MPSPLFSTYDLGALLRGHEAKMYKEIDDMPADALLSATLESLCDYFESGYRITTPTLRQEAIQMGQKEIDVDVSGDPLRGFFDRSQPFYVKGSQIDFYVPFEGDSQIFACRANQYSLSLPQADVREGELVLSYVRTDHDAAAVKREFDNDLARIKQQLDWSRSQADGFNRTIRANAASQIGQRREKLLRDRGVVESLGYPLRRRQGAPETFAVPAVRRKPAVARPVAASAPFRPEPALEMAEYEHILNVISNMVLVMERSPQAFKGMKEEDLRQHFLVQLNGQYEGQATGETFNFEGKTDILIRAESRNIFIAECKFWRGPEFLRETIDQLLGYASWRDTKTSILVFNRDKNFSAVLTKIPEIVKAHPNFKRQTKYESETGFRFVLHHRDDKNRELTLTVLVFEVPA